MKCPLDKLPGNAATTVDKSKDMVEIDGKLKAAWTLELLSTRKQVVAPPSLHPDTGQRYTWVSGEIGIVPDALLHTPEIVASPYLVPNPNDSTRLPSADVWGEGERYTRLLSYAGRLQAQGWKDAQIGVSSEYV